MSEHNLVSADEARDWIERGMDRHHHRAFRRALRTLASMTTETDYRIVDPFTNGGKYETVRHTRHVTEWSKSNEH